MKLKNFANLKEFEATKGNEMKTDTQTLLDNSGPLEAFAMGYDAGKNGVNTTNCNFKLFNTPEKTKAWERGKAKGEEDKLK